MGLTHSAATAACHGLDHDRIADLLGDLERLPDRFRQCRRCGSNRTPALRAVSRATALFTMARIEAGFGPMNLMLQLSQPRRSGHFRPGTHTGMDRVDVTDLGGTDESDLSQVTILTGTYDTDSLIAN